MYAEGHLLVRDDYLGRVLEILQRDEPDQERDEPDRVRRVIAGAVLLNLGETQLTVPEALSEIDRQLGAGIATPNQVLTTAPEVGPCAATEPQLEI
jgi:hypothetical protein